MTVPKRCLQFGVDHDVHKPGPLDVGPEIVEAGILDCGQGFGVLVRVHDNPGIEHNTSVAAFYGHFSTIYDTLV